MVSFSAEDFVGALTSEDGLSLPTLPVMKAGLVDRAESTAEAIRFAPGIQCSNWVKVPVEIIDQVDYLGNQRCGEDEYPYVRLQLDQTALTDREQAIIAILQSSTTAGPAMTAPTSLATPPPVSPTPPAGQPGPLPAGQPGPLPAGQPGPLPAGQPGPLPAGQPGPLPAGQPGPPHHASRHKDPNPSTFPVHLRGCG